MSKDYYRILGVSPSANSQEIKSAYRRLALRYHPDTNPNDPKAAAKFHLLAEAYRTLINPKRRADYDAKYRPSTPRPTTRVQGDRVVYRAYTQEHGRIYEEVRDNHTTVDTTVTDKKELLSALPLIGFFMVLMICFFSTTTVLNSGLTQQSQANLNAIHTVTVRAQNAAVTSSPRPILSPTPNPLATYQTLSSTRRQQLQARSLDTLCTLFLTTHKHDCPADTVAFIAEPSNNNAIIEIDLDLADYQGILFEITYGSRFSEWSLNIGDSRYNDGTKSPSRPEPFNAQLVISNNTLLIFGDEDTPSSSRTLFSQSNIIRPRSTVFVEVAHHQVRWGIGSLTAQLTSPNLYNLTIQDSKIYAAFNRVIYLSNPSRGEGIQAIVIRLVPR